MSCQHDCQKPPVFPVEIFNRPALDEILYRIGDYSSFRDFMLDRLDNSRPLAGWTHRAADDPGIALLEGAATVAEVISFYQTLYANEVFLRTANWRESVVALVALTGYRLAPGVGGKARFALAVDSDDPVVVPKGFGFKAQLEGAEAPAVFESVEASTAYSILNEFPLYRPRLAPGSISAGTSELELHRVDGSNKLEDLEAYEVNPGDRIMIIPDTTVWDLGGGSWDASRAQARPETLIVSEVEQTLDRIVLRFEGSLRISRGTSIRAFKIDRSFRHFGFNAPRTIGVINESTGIMNFRSTEFIRDIWRDHTWSGDDTDFYSRVDREDVPLDTEVDDLALGSKLICDGYHEFSGVFSPLRFAVVREIVDVRPDSVSWGGMTSGTSVVQLDDRLIANRDISVEKADIRHLQFHETLGPEISLRAPTAWHSGSFGTSTGLSYYGTHAEATTLAERDLLIEGPDEQHQSVRVITTRDEFLLTGKDETNQWMWSIELDQPPIFAREVFDESNPRVSAFGNLVLTDEGETQDSVVLGSGDGRQRFQTYAIPKPPLSYHLDPSQELSTAAELDIYVDGVLWNRVDTLYSSSSHERVYIIREDDDGQSFVQFGDGIIGKRLRSGRNNVSALFRSGVGARGVLETDTTPSATGKLKPLTDIYLREAVVGGGDPESEDNARLAAPGRMQTLGRLVGLADYEADARSIAGVLKANAAWAAPSGSPLIQIVVLTENGLAEEAVYVEKTMRAYDRCRGANRHTIIAVQGFRQFLYASVTLGYAADRQPESIRVAALEALGVAGEEANGLDGEQGLFGLDPRHFGQGAHVSQVLGYLQHIDGVTWARVEAFESLPLGVPPETDPLVIGKPVTPVRHEAIDCPSAAVLTLHTAHVDIALVLDSNSGECEL